MGTQENRPRTLEKKMKVREMLRKAGMKRAEIREKAVFLDGYRIDPEISLEEGAELCITDDEDDPRNDVFLFQWLSELPSGMKEWLRLMGPSGMYDPRFAEWSILRVGKEHYLMKRTEKE